MSLEISRILNLIVATSLDDVARALLLANSLNRVAVRDWSIPLIQLPSMGARILHIVTVLVLRSLSAGH